MLTFNKSLWFFALCIPLLSSCSNQPRFFSLANPQTQLSTDQINTGSVKVRQSIGGLLELTSTLPGSQVKLLISTDESTETFPSITATITNINQQPVYFSNANIASSFQGQLSPSLSQEAWLRELQRQESNQAWAVAAGVFVGFVILLELLDSDVSSNSRGHIQPINLVDAVVFSGGHHNSWFFGQYGTSPHYYNHWSFTPVWYDRWHGQQGYLYQMHYSGQYRESELKETAKAIGNYLVPGIISKGASVGGTVKLNSIRKGKGSSPYSIIVEVGQDKHVFDTRLNFVH